MKSDPTYSEALKELEQLVAEIETDALELDQLAAKVKRANELIAFCEQRLRSIEGDVAAASHSNERPEPETDK